MKVGGKMIPKINGATPVLTKIAKNPKAAVLAATTGTLAVLATGQAWPHCNGILGHDMPIPSKTPEVPDINLEGAQNNFDMPSAMDFIKHPIDSTTEVMAHAVDKTQTAFDNVRDFFESLGH